tara:strand:+ start:248 stop:475 length:228 start_codon:yes stop_codon:yes gene_type:complete
MNVDKLIGQMKCELSQEYEILTEELKRLNDLKKGLEPCYNSDEIFEIETRLKEIQMEFDKVKADEEEYYKKENAK